MQQWKQKQSFWLHDLDVTFDLLLKNFNKAPNFFILKLYCRYGYTRPYMINRI